MRKFKKLVLPGFEPGTFALSARRTTNCAIAPFTLFFSFLFSFHFSFASRLFVWVVVSFPEGTDMVKKHKSKVLQLCCSLLPFLNCLLLYPSILSLFSRTYPNAKGSFHFHLCAFFPPSFFVFVSLSLFPCLPPASASGSFVFLGFVHLLVSVSLSTPLVPMIWGVGEPVLHEIVYLD